MSGNLIRGYTGVLRGHRGKAAASVATATFAGVSEAIALASMIPLIQGSGLISSGGKSSGGKYSFLGLTGDRLAQWAFASFVVFGMIAAVARYFGERMMVGMAGDAERRTRNEAANRVLSLEWEEMTLERSGALQKSVVDNPFHINLGVMAILGGLGQAGAGMMLALGAFVVAPAMTLAACVFGSLIGVFYQRFGRRTYSINQDLSKAATRLSSVTSEVFRRKTVHAERSSQ